MADEYSETDLETPTEDDLDEAYGSKFLGVTDVGDKKIRTKILKVTKDSVRDRETNRMKKKILVFFENIDKPMPLNVTNKNILVDALGKTPANWLGASVGIKVDPNVTFAGKKVGGVRLQVLLPPAAAEPVAKSAAKPKSKPPAAVANEYQEEGDPGPDPSMADCEPAE